jgi:hypothetical protein
MYRDDYDWCANNSNVVLRAYGSIAVHENPYGDLVIRQERDALEEDDHWLVVPVQDAEHVAQAIIAKAKELKEGWGDPREDQQDEGAQKRLALPAPAPNGKHAVPPVKNGGAGTTKAGAPHG